MSTRFFPIFCPGCRESQCFAGELDFLQGHAVHVGKLGFPHSQLGRKWLVTPPMSSHKESSNCAPISVRCKHIAYTNISPTTVHCFESLNKKSLMNVMNMINNDKQTLMNVSSFHTPGTSVLPILQVQTMGNSLASWRLEISCIFLQNMLDVLIIECEGQDSLPQQHYQRGQAHFLCFFCIFQNRSSVSSVIVAACDWMLGGEHPNEAGWLAHQGLWHRHCMGLIHLSISLCRWHFILDICWRQKGSKRWHIRRMLPVNWPNSRSRVTWSRGATQRRQWPVNEDEKKIEDFVAINFFWPVKSRLSEVLYHQHV